MRFIPAIVKNAFLIFWTLLAVGPFLLIVLLSFRDNVGIFGNALGLTGSLHPENYSEAWAGPVGSAGMGVFLGNSAVVFVVALLVNIVLGSIGSYFSTRLSSRMRAAYLGIFLAATVVPFVLILIPLYRMVNAFGFVSNPVALGVLYGVMALPTTVLIMSAFFADFPREVVEAAYVDGLTEFTAFWRIVLPLSKGTLVTVSLLLAIWTWSEAQIAIVMLQDASSQTAAVGVLGFKGQFTTNYGSLFAGLSIAAIPVVVLYLVFNKYITKGIALGGISK
ncbi:carbohydrate ABC transporter permease [Pseudonocardia sp. TRM90224]|uniref:carbohydrate ABC transporter permease n=1 Tax=Pseudonocardia sp. TRM90224 TaxID=2812678 RepID=UPI001E5C6B33|nr:carbohydrate ABC transporter permease [Pseudonocardia sp. TRM90224]